jgi:hypothetical protein
MDWVRERTIPTERHLSAKLVPAFVDRGCHMVSMTDPYGHILDFLDRHYMINAHIFSSCLGAWLIE